MLKLRDTDLYRLLVPHMEWTGSRDGVHLTIDDGPTPGVTEPLLDMLDRHKTKATFFCIGRNVERHPALYDEILKRGHQVGNHTYSHIMGWNVSLDEYINDVALAADIINSNLFRPPYGRITARQFLALKKQYRMIMGNVVSRDYSFRVSPEKCLRLASTNIYKGDILVFHDSLKAHKNTLYALPRTLSRLKHLEIPITPL